MQVDSPSNLEYRDSKAITGVFHSLACETAKEKVAFF